VGALFVSAEFKRDGDWEGDPEALGVTRGERARPFPTVQDMLAAHYHDSHGTHSTI